ncbi:MAG: hypothetical protein H8D56_13330 [Planctomycetes bacterium]|nr:hypothetical protein [Planctomycetota bacterium]MBL7146840.1 hypothetical protein [Phycisphaerae bacterium]
MNAINQIISKQTEWAKNRGIGLIGSRGTRGRKAYTRTLGDNLYLPLNVNTKNEINDGDGGELKGMAGHPSKMQAIHSSSALGVNIFDYWRASSDLSVICSACGLSRAGKELNGEIRFEQKFSIDDRFQYSPNLDVVIFPRRYGKYAAFAIECKFTEAYSARKHGGFDPKYFENQDIWQNLPATKGVAQAISPYDSHFKYLHVAQLIKHILGLNHKFGHMNYRLLYLWYDALGEHGFNHRQEVEEFKSVVRSDGVVFHEATYQEVIIKLAQHRKKHHKYVVYLTDRYL